MASAVCHRRRLKLAANDRLGARFEQIGS